ncbi:MAG: hypothetical protein KatS3mg001_147 [Candidatus Pacearchaeota archaeon]|nr:MAG: hypothetical protein KatS3mg001_147 [Candidatus Pacearchaeota archaeon]
MSLKILNKEEKREIEKKLKEQFGIKKINGLVLMRGKERLFLFSGNLNEDKIKKIEEKVNVERVGIYFAKVVEDKLKLSLDGTQLFKSQITKNILEVNEEQMKEWMSGSDLFIKTGKKDFLVIKYKEDFLGCGKVSENKIRNFVPKNRRIKK